MQPWVTSDVVCVSAVAKREDNVHTVLPQYGKSYIIIVTKFCHNMNIHVRPYKSTEQWDILEMKSWCQLGVVGIRVTKILQKGSHSTHEPYIKQHNLDKGIQPHPFSVKLKFHYTTMIYNYDMPPSQYVMATFDSYERQSVWLHWHTRSLPL